MNVVEGDREMSAVRQKRRSGEQVSITDKLVQIVGEERATDDKTVRYIYSKDASMIEGMPDYVVQPTDAKEVVEIVSLANKQRIPITPRGAGTGVSGGCVPIHGGIALDMTRFNRIIDIDTANLYAIVEAGVIEGKLNEELAKQGFFFAPDPASARWCTLGGLVGNNGGGSSGLKYGVTKHHVLGLEVVLPSGVKINTGSRVFKTDSGYDLTSLLVGAEGTLGVVTQIILKILPLPEFRSTVIAYFDDLEKPGNALLKVLSKRIIPAACEIMDKVCIDCVNMVVPVFRQAEALLLFRLEGSEEAVKKEVAGVVASCKESGAVEAWEPATKGEEEMLWRGRSALAPAAARTGKAACLSGSDDFGVPLTRIPDMLREIKRITQGKKFIAMTCAHIGDGNLHIAAALDWSDEEEVRQYLKAVDEIYGATLKLGGTVACEHGIGATKIKWLKQEHKSSYPLMETIKKAIDPNNIMNPGKMFD
jgi:glycolate oxidase